MICTEEPVILGDGTLGECIFRGLMSREEKHFKYMVDIAQNVSLTYHDMLRYSINLTVSLEKLGIKETDVVGLFSENCWESIITIIAIWNIGASVAFINPNYIKSELYYSLKIKEPKYMFTTRNKLKVLEDNISHIMEIILFDEECQDNKRAFKNLLLDSEITFQNYKHKQFDTKETIACIMSSSGTTGLPKAVMLTQDNMKWCLKYMSDPNTVNLNSKSRTVLYLPLFHVMGLMLCIASINKGEKLVIVRKFNADQFITTLEDYGVNFLVVVPPVLQFLAKSPLVLKHNLSCVEHIICGGASASMDIEMAVTSRLTNAKVRQVYGMTEVSGAVTAGPIKENRFGSVGKAFKGISIKIVDPISNKVLGPNTKGEICIKGPAVMKGYMKNPEATADCIDSDGFMHSGDIGYYDADGFLFVVDRIKELIKYKAFQVAPAEIEALIIKHKAVTDVAIVGKPDERCGELPTAFVVVQPGEHVIERDICDYVADNFSHEKHLHGGVYFVSKIPKTASGKILRRELRKLLGDS